MLNKHKKFEIFCFFFVNGKYLFVSLLYVISHFCLRSYDRLLTISRNYDTLSYMIAV